MKDVTREDSCLERQNDSTASVFFLKHETGGANSNTRSQGDLHLDSCNNKNTKHSKAGPETEQGQHEWDDERNGPSGLCYLDFAKFRMGISTKVNDASQLQEHGQSFEARRFTLRITLKFRNETERGHAESGVG